MVGQVYPYNYDPIILATGFWRMFGMCPIAAVRRCLQSCKSVLVNVYLRLLQPGIEDWRRGGGEGRGIHTYLSLLKFLRKKEPASP